MGDIFGGGGGGGGGDEVNQTEKALPSPAQIAATRDAFNTASGVAGLAKNLPYFSQIASSPGYRQALQNTANTWSNWMGTAPIDLSEGMAPISEGPFGSVIDAGNIMNQQIAGLPPEVQSMISQWAGPGMIAPKGPYAPAVYDPYVQQKPLLHQGSQAAGGVGTVGAGGIPYTAPAGSSLTQTAIGTTPPLSTGTTTPPPPTGTTNPKGEGSGANSGTGPRPGSIVHRGGGTYRVGQNGQLIRMYGVRRRPGEGGKGEGGFAARGGYPGQWGSTGPTRGDL